MVALLLDGLVGFPAGLSPTSFHLSPSSFSFVSQAGCLWSGSRLTCLLFPLNSFHVSPTSFHLSPTSSLVSHFFSFVSQAGCLWSRLACLPLPSGSVLVVRFPAGLSPTSLHLSPISFYLSPSSFHLSRLTCLPLPCICLPLLPFNSLPTFSFVSHTGCFLKIGCPPFTGDATSILAFVSQVCPQTGGVRPLGHAGILWSFVSQVCHCW